jgi:UDP-2,4-diacetamido-2,4,6-trideoxy-beta-L-altropyranose hydrolase
MLKNKNFFFRINFDEKIGFGHLARSLKIADKLNYPSYFIVDINRNYSFTNKINHSFNYLYNSKFTFNEIEDAKRVYNIIKKKTNPILFIDDYRIGNKWLNFFKKKKIKIIILDDLLDRKFNCDIYINYKLDTSEEHKNKLDYLINKNARKILGPKFSIIDKSLKKKKSRDLNIMFNFGNSFNYESITDQIKKLYINTKKINKKINFIIPIGYGATNYKKLLTFSRGKKQFNIILKKFGIVQYLNKTDLFFGSASNAIYEMSFLKTPSVFFVCNKNQKYNIFDIEKLGHYFLLDIKDLTSKNFLIFFKGCLKNLSKIQKLYKKNIYKIDNKGTDRIVKILNRI